MEKYVEYCKSQKKPRTCETCKWWGIIMDKELKGFGACIFDIDDEKYIKTREDIYTHQDFGCIFHQPKE